MMSRTAQRAMLPHTIAMPPRPAIASATDKIVYVISPPVLASPITRNLSCRTRSRSGMTDSRSRNIATASPGTYCPIVGA
jgi:hypothetical protein